MARIGMRRVERGERRIGNTGTQRHVRAPGIVMRYPRFQDAPQMRFRQGNQPIQALATNGADHWFADGIRLGTSARSFQYRDSELPDRLIDMAPKNAIASVQSVIVSPIEPHHLTKQF